MLGFRFRNHDTVSLRRQNGTLVFCLLTEGGKGGVRGVCGVCAPSGSSRAGHKMRFIRMSHAQDLTAGY